MVMTIATPEIISAMLAHSLSLKDMFNDSGLDVASKQSQIEYVRFGSKAASHKFSSPAAAFGQ
jgi:hypothetical protein